MRRAVIIVLVVLIALILLGLGWHFFVDRKAPLASALPQVTAADHILGNPGAPILLVEYCDIESPYCTSFQSVMESIVAAYGSTGRVAWVYRHFPLTGLYPDAEQLAEASECAAAQGGTTAFFKFIDAFDAQSSTINTSDPASYQALTGPLGLDAGTFQGCIANHSYQTLVTTQGQDALRAGGTGAPYTVLLIQGQPAIPIQGAFSYGQMKQIIDTVLAKLPNS